MVSVCVIREEQCVGSFVFFIKNQISETSSAINNFNETVQKLEIDERALNADIKLIQQSITDISDNMQYSEVQFHVLGMCENLLESYTFLESMINYILNSITFLRLKIIHTSIITPRNLIYFWNDVSQV